MKIKYISLLIASALTANAQTLIGFEDFDGGEINLSSTSNVYTVGTEPGITSPADAFGITDNVTIGGPFSFWDATVLDTAAVGNFPSDVLGLGGINTTAFWGMDDPDGGSDVVANNNATWSFDFGTPESLQSIQIDIAAMGDYEAGDGFIIEAQLDGGGYQTIFQGITNEDIDHTYRLFDDGVTAPTLPDPLEIYIDGSGTAAGILDKADSATGDFDTYTSILFSGQSATTVDVRIRWDGTTSGGEPMGFDNISIFAGAAVPTLVVTETDGSTDVTEGGATDSIEFVLTTTPSANVDVTLTPDTELDLGNGAGNPVVLNFTPGDATTAQFATVTAFDDAVLEGLHSGTISVLTASTDGDYDALSDTINVSITDNDSAAAGDLIITQYYEGNSNDRYIELTNVGNTSIDVTGYVITRWSNENNEDYKTAGGTPAGTLDLTPLGTLAAGQSVILANGDASTPIRAIDADLTQTFAEGGALSFNGDDSVVLYASSTIDPSNIVDAIGFTGANEGANVSFVRAAQLQGYNLVAGSNATSFPSVWTSVPVSTADGASLGDDAFLGSTSLVTLTTVSFVQGSLTVAEDDGSFDIDVAMSGLTSGSVSVDVTFDSGSSTADASDFTFTSPSPLTFTVDGTQTINVPIVDDGLDGSTEVASFTLSITSGTASLFTSTFDVSIQDSDIVIPDLIISEIADPSDDFNARFVEIYNPTGSPVDLGAGNWNLVRFSNGAALGTGVDIPLTGEISAGGTYVIAFTDISGPYHTAAYGTTADQESSNINGNGDDVYALFIEGDDDD
ncbi:MAG: lamin tail domain-containing protein, partial [Opitutales bacterium]